MSFCILRTEKLKTFGNIAGSGEHNFRERETKNADSIRTHLNKTSGAQDTEEVITGIKSRLSTVPTIRKNAVLALEYFIGASPEFFASASEKQREAYFDDAEKWLKARHGVENVIAVTRQYDETSPHICAYVVPIDPGGKLNCSHFQDGREKLQAMQTDFAERVGSRHNLERGIEGSTATHTTIKDYYATVNAPAPLIKTQIPKVPEPTFTDRASEAIGFETDHSKAVDRAEIAKKARALEVKAQRQAEQAKAKQFDLLQRNVKAREASLAHLRANAVQLRRIDLKAVLERFGATLDPKDKNNWRASTGRITLTDTKFFNHDTSSGGGGAIDLVIHLNETDYRGAVQWLANEFGVGAVVSQVATDAKKDVESAVLAPKPPYVAPEPSPENWHVVRDYLHQARKISLEIIDGLKHQGKLYADKFKNCVFVFSGGLGVELRGTSDQPFHGMRGKKTGFILRRGAEDVKKVAFVESSIEAISLYELGKFNGKIIATGGNAATMAREAAEKYRQDGYVVYAAFNNDKSGDAQASGIGSAERLRPVLNDWNNDLAASKAPPPPPPAQVSPVNLQIQRQRRDDQQSEYARMRG